MAFLKPGVVCIAGVLPPSINRDALETAETFSQKGWSVHILCGNSGKELKQESERWERSFLVHETDPLKEESINIALDEILAVSHGIDLFIYWTESAAVQKSGDSFLGIDYSRALEHYNRCALGYLRLVQGLRPALERGSTRRLGIVTDSSALLNSSKAVDGFEVNMTQAAIHTAGAVLFNRLHPLGYTFRVFTLDDSCPLPAVSAYDYFVRDRSFEPGNRLHSDESRYTPCDGLGRERAW